MFYENKVDKKKDYFLIIAFILIMMMLVILILKIDTNEDIRVQRGNYETTSLSTELEQNVDNEKKKTIKEVIKSVVGISKLQQNGSSIFLGNSEEKLGLGSGIILSENGYILTNEHVVGSKYSNCYVTLENGKSYNGSVVWADNNLDLAIVKIVANKLDYIALGDSDVIELADDVYAIGNPIGIEFQRTVTKGIISGKDRTIKIEENGKLSYMEDLIQTDATINIGNSGGPLINTEGELIGINTVKIKDADGIGFAVPINIIKPILEKFIKDGSFEEAYLGIYGYDKEVIPYLNSNLKLESGVYVAYIQPDGPLFNKELKVGDVITKIDDIEINKMNELRNYIYNKKPGDTVKLNINRIDKQIEINTVLGNKL